MKRISIKLLTDLKLVVLKYKNDLGQKLFPHTLGVIYVQGAPTKTVYSIYNLAWVGLNISQGKLL